MSTYDLLTQKLPEEEVASLENIHIINNVLK